MDRGRLGIRGGAGRMAESAGERGLGSFNSAGAVCGSLTLDV